MTSKGKGNDNASVRPPDFWRLLFDGLALPALVAKEDGRVEAANRAALSLFGQTAESMRQRRLNALFDGLEVVPVEAESARKDSPVTCVRADGKKLEATLTWSLLEDPSGP